MNNDAVVEAEANVEGARQHPESMRQDLDSKGEAALLVATGGVDNFSDESSPLLSAQDTATPTWSEEFETDFGGLPWWKIPSIFLLLPPFLLFTLAFGGTMVPKINLIKDLLCRDYLADQMAMDPALHYEPIDFGHPNEQCRIPGVQAKASEFMLLASVISGLLSAITSPKLGALSDRYGRIRIICITSAGPLVGEVLTIMAATKPETFTVNWLYLSYILDGLCGSFIASMALSHAYAADSTPPERRNVTFGYFHGILFTGVGLGPLLAAAVIKATGSLLPMFYFATACHLLFLSCLIFIIPESLSQRRQKIARQRYTRDMEHLYSKNTKWRARLQLLNLLEPLKVLRPTGEGASPALRRNLLLLCSIDTIMFGVAMGAMTVVVYYSGYVFKWDTPEQSVFIALANCSRVVCLFVILPSVTRYVRGPASQYQTRQQTGCDKLDLYIIRAAVLFDTLGYLGYALARTGPVFMLSGVVAAIGGIGSPTMSSSLTKHVPADRTGQLLGASGLLHALARVVAPVVFNGIYAATVAKYKPTVFFFLAGTFGAALVLTFALRAGIYLDDGKQGATSTQRDLLEQEEAEEEELRL